MLDNVWYIDDGNNSSTGWWALTQWSNNGGLGTAWTAGQIIRQSGTPTVGNERVYVCVIAGTGGTTTDPLTTFTRGVVIADGTATFQEATGVAALNGDLTNTPTWAQMRASSTTATLGQVIQTNSGSSYQICTVQGTVGASQPAFSDTAGTATTDNGATWRSLGVVGNFTTIFAAPHARMANAFTSTWGAAGNSFYTHNTSAETQTTAMTLTSPGTAALPCYAASVGTGAVPPTSVTAGASLATTGASAITWNGQYTTFEGFSFLAGSAANTANIALAGSSTCGLIFRYCSLTINNTSNSSRFNLSGGTVSGIDVLLYNCTMTFGSSASQQFSTGGTNISTVRIIGGSVVLGATTPTTLFGNRPTYLLLQAVDFSALPIGKTLIGDTGSSGVTIIQDCKLATGVTVAATPTVTNERTYLIRSDSGNTNYRQEAYSYGGAQTVETTIVRTGGASDGTTPISWKFVTTANSHFIQPFEAIPFQIKNTTLTPTTQTITVFGVTAAGGVPNNDDVWFDVEYLGTSGFPLGVIATTTKASNLATGTALSADTSVWGGGVTPFKISMAITVQSGGYMFGYVKVAKAASTYYIDPLPVLS